MDTLIFAVLVILNIATFGFSVIAPLMRQDKYLNLCIGIAIFASGSIMLINGLYGLSVISTIALVRQYLAYRYADRWTHTHLLYAAHVVAVLSALVTFLNYQNWTSFWGALDNVMCAYGFILLTGVKLRILTLIHGVIWTCIGWYMQAPGVIGAASFMGVTSIWAMYEMKYGLIRAPWLDKFLLKFGVKRTAFEPGLAS